MQIGVSKKVFYRVRSLVKQSEYRELASAYDIRGYKRLYLVHIRKTGGTSLNNMFLSLGSKTPGKLYQELARHPEHRLIKGGKVFVGWARHLIDRGNYFYAFSHTPLHKLDLPDGTFTITCFRDPVKRVISHYNMLMDFAIKDIPHPCMKTEGQWLGNSFDDFLDRIPRSHLQNQLYMFSEHFDIDEAIERINKLSLHFFLKDFSEGIKQLNEKTGLGLEPIHVRKAGHRAQIPKASIARLRDLLADEYALLERVARL